MEGAVMRKYISDVINHGIKGHKKYDFVDVAINDDTKLFIDPLLIENSKDPWCKKAHEIIISFFNSFYSAYRNNDEQKKKILLSHATEINQTRLGYGRGNNGKGNTQKGLLTCFESLEDMIRDITTMNRASDLKVLIQKFSDDGLSDLLTNVLHGPLIEYTKVQMSKFGMEPNIKTDYYTWDLQTESWILVSSEGYSFDGQELLLVPKSIVRKKHLFSTKQFFMRVILERILNENFQYADSRPSKKQMLKKLGFSGERWVYEMSIIYAKEHNDALIEYHEKLPIFYQEYGRPLSNDELDEYVYK